jgi:uncharacterized protein YneF (UPF0154 family)
MLAILITVAVILLATETYGFFVVRRLYHACEKLKKQVLR